MIESPARTHAVICTRTPTPDNRLLQLIDYYIDAGVNVRLEVAAESIWDGYRSGIEAANPDPEDIVILCHDDVNILSSKQIFFDVLKACLDPKIGFVGPIGSIHMPDSGFWWDGGVSGMIFLGESYQACKILGGGYVGPSVILDGLFMAAQWKKLCRVGLEKPSYLETNWHFYDVHLSCEMRDLGYENVTRPFFVLHAIDHKDDAGFNAEWIAAREAFCEHRGLSGERPMAVGVTS